ncbi:RNA-binding domain-containing protein [Gymnopus androsaceus JB14]|uniref:RNA-binding domain-containing protein n=1 Tax=Gymnopus androsaceus JB14 TaxID=1447944 RepID=A0A6A4I553_9AGAR|nr:RNA-binding domain-containing protein [Gymnopus androsaceus JB14]
MSGFRGNRGGNKPYSRPPPRGGVDGQWLHDKAPGTQTLNGDSRRGPSESSEPNSKLIVSNLHYEVTPKDLIAIFGQIGTLVREPLIRYDRSGRSLGNAFVFYETVAEATKAKKTFDGVIAKGKVKFICYCQPMSIVYEMRPSRRAVSAPHSSLINRIQKPPLADRLSSDDSKIRDSSGPGPTRSKHSRRGGRGSNRGGGAQRSEPKSNVPKTAEELDKELDYSAAAGPVAEQSASAVVEQDVEMA